MGYDALRTKVEVVDISHTSRDYLKTHDLGRGPAGDQYEHPFSDVGHGLMASDWQEGINFERMRRERLEKARIALSKTDADALFCFRLENVRYLTSFRTCNPPMMMWGVASVVLLNDGKTPPLLYNMDVDYCRMTMPWIRETTFISPGGGLESAAGAQTWVTQLKNHLRDFGISKLEKIAMDSWSSGMYEGFPEALQGTKFIDGQAIMLEARCVKTWDEIQCLKMAHLITMAGVQAGLEVLKPGVRECDVRTEIFRVMNSYGSEGSQTQNCIVASGGATAPYRRFTSDKIIDYGDPVIMDMGACYNNYYGDMTRTYICGKNARPSSRLVELHTTAYNALRRAEKALRPGATTYDVGKACGAEYIMGGLLGHGLGIAGAEQPFIGSPSPAAETAAQNIEPGMVFSIEPYYGEVGIGGIRLEDVLVVTDNGAEIITRFPFDERLIDEKAVEDF